MPLSPDLRGSLFMTAAMAAFAVEDALLKSAAASLPPGEVLMIFGALGLALFAALTRAAGEALLPPALWSRTMALRSVAEVTGRLFFMLALALTLPVQLRMQQQQQMQQQQRSA